LRLILASSSAIRRAMLAAAGVEFDTLPPQVDEAEIKRRISATDAIASQLAAAKGLAVSKHEPEAWVIGSDSVVQVEGRHFNKPESRQEAADHLRFFSGKAMRLTSAVALVRAGEIVWQYDDTATLQVRKLSESFIEDYLDAEWPEVGYCVGVFRMEARGVQLFDRIDGDHFTILGMPLLPVLGALRERGLVPA
jgi:septum formation protein